MAKSIRSKRMRKLRAFKRIRYGEKELARLKKMVEKATKDEEEAAATQELVKPVEMEQDLNPGAATAAAAEVTKQNKYPCWLSHFKIKKLAKAERKRKVKEAKRLKKEKKNVLKKSKKSKKK